MTDNTLPIKVTLRPQQIKKVKKFAKENTKGNFSMALRGIIDRWDDSYITIKDCYTRETYLEDRVKELEKKLRERG